MKFLAIGQGETINPSLAVCLGVGIDRSRVGQLRRKCIVLYIRRFEHLK